MVTASPTPSRNPSLIVVLKPESSAVTLYVPSGIAGIRNVPFAAVVAVRDVPVSTCVAVRLTPGSTAPLSSKTVPRNSPCASWPSAGDAHTATNATADARNRIVIGSSQIPFSNGTGRYRCGTWSVDIVLVRFHGGGV